jgi:hypothetical protein
MHNLTIFFLLFFLNSTLSQNNYEYFGILKLNDNIKQTISYNLNFKLENGIIKGYSITDLGGDYETKNILSGTYNQNSKILTFHEEKILYTKSILEASTFCFVNFLSKVNIDNENNKITGNFQGLYQNKTKCINGSLILISNTKIHKKLKKADNKIQSSKKIDSLTKSKINAVTFFNSLKINNLTKNQNLNIFSNSKKVTLEIWDNKAEDGDIINLYQNEKLVFSDYPVTKTKKSITLELNGNSTVFKIEAVNEGSISPNTSNVIIKDDIRTFELVSNLKKGENATITIVNQ